jgi:hypothetical protein
MAPDERPIVEGRKLEKPADCTCEYPRLIARNGCGHTEPCPVYERFMARFPNLDPRRQELR